MNIESNGAQVLMEVPPKKAAPRSLYHITEDLLAIDELLLEVGGVLSTETVAEAVAQWFDELGQESEAKLENYVRLILDKQARAKALKEEAQRLQVRASVESNGVERLKTALTDYMDSRQQTKLNAGMHRLSLAQNGGKQAMTVLVDAEDLPDKYTSRVADTEAIRAALEQGSDDIDGLARLEPRGRHLRIS